MKDTRTIFLDIDGVLNSSEFFRESYAIYQDKNYDDLMYQLDELAIIALKKLFDELSIIFNVKFVLSSTWRKYHRTYDRINTVLYNYKIIDYVLPKTGDSKSGHRGKEIIEYCKNNNIPLDKLIVIDDDFVDTLDTFDIFQVLTTHWEIGLTEKAVDSFILKYKNSKFWGDSNETIRKSST
jgi:hypothetical protein